MRKSFKLVLVAIAFFSFVFCTDDNVSNGEGVAEAQLEVATLADFSSNQETQTVNITANMYWFTEVDVNWVTLTPRFGTNNGSINVTVNANPNAEMRTGTFTVIGGSLSNTIAIKQAAKTNNSGTLDPNKPPSQNFDLSTWKLNTPENNGSGFAKTISVSEMTNGYQNNNYFYTAADGGLVFKCPIAGFKTSANTSYTRVELREMLRGTNTNISTQGVNKNNWVFGSAPAADKLAAAGFDGEMDATLAVNYVTTTGSSGQVGRVIIGQIHANDDEPVRLYYRKLPNIDLGSIYFAHEPRDGFGSEQWVEIIGSRSNSAANPTDGIALNEKFSYKIKTVNNLLTVTISRDGKPDLTKTVDMSNSGYDVGGQYMYFKAGLYQGNNSGDANDYVQATFYELEKSHTVN